MSASTMQTVMDLIDGRTGKVKNQVTRGDWVVREVVKVDDAKRQIWLGPGRPVCLPLVDVEMLV